MSHDPKPLVWLHGEVRTPPLSAAARIETGVLLRRLQNGESLTLPDSRPMPSIGPHCHELRIVDERASWRLVYRIDPDAILVVEVFRKTTRATPRRVLEACRRRLARYDAAASDHQGE